MAGNPSKRQETAFSLAKTTKRKAKKRKNPKNATRMYVWYGMVWYGMVWYGMVWYGMVWYGMYVCMYVCMYVRTCVCIMYTHDIHMTHTASGARQLWRSHELQPVHQGDARAGDQQRPLRHVCGHRHHRRRNVHRQGCRRAVGMSR